MATRRSVQEDRSIGDFLGNFAGGIGDIAGGLVSLGGEALKRGPLGLTDLLAQVPAAYAQDIANRYGPLLPGGRPAGETLTSLYEDPAMFALDALDAGALAKAAPKVAGYADDLTRRAGVAFQTLPESPVAQRIASGIEGGKQAGWPIPPEGLDWSGLDAKIAEARPRGFTGAQPQAVSQTLLQTPELSTPTLDTLKRFQMGGEEGAVNFDPKAGRYIEDTTGERAGMPQNTELAMADALDMSDGTIQQLVSRIGQDFSQLYSEILFSEGPQAAQEFARTHKLDFIENHPLTAEIDRYRQSSRAMSGDLANEAMFKQQRLAQQGVGAGEAAWNDAVASSDAAARAEERTARAPNRVGIGLDEEGNKVIGGEERLMFDPKREVAVPEGGYTINEIRQKLAALDEQAPETLARNPELQGLGRGLEEKRLYSSGEKSLRRPMGRRPGELESTGTGLIRKSEREAKLQESYGHWMRFEREHLRELIESMRRDVGDPLTASEDIRWARQELPVMEAAYHQLTKQARESVGGAAAGVKGQAKGGRIKEIPLGDVARVSDAVQLDAGAAMRELEEALQGIEGRTDIKPPTLDEYREQIAAEIPKGRRGAVREEKVAQAESYKNRSQRAANVKKANQKALRQEQMSVEGVVPKPKTVAKGEKVTPPKTYDFADKSIEKLQKALKHWESEGREDAYVQGIRDEIARRELGPAWPWNEATSGEVPGADNVTPLDVGAEPGRTDVGETLKKVKVTEAGSMQDLIDAYARGDITAQEFADASAFGKSVEGLAEELAPAAEEASKAARKAEMKAKSPTRRSKNEAATPVRKDLEGLTDAKLKSKIDYWENQGRDDGYVKGLRQELARRTSEAGPAEERVAANVVTTSGGKMPSASKLSKVRTDFRKAKGVNPSAAEIAAKLGITDKAVIKRIRQWMKDNPYRG